MRILTCGYFTFPPACSELAAPGMCMCVSVRVYTHKRCTHTHMYMYIIYIYPPAPCLRLQFYTGGSNYYYNGTHPTEALQHSTVDSQLDFSFKNTYTRTSSCLCVCIYMYIAVCLPFLVVIVPLFLSSSYFLVPPGEAGGELEGEGGGGEGKSSPEVSVGCSGLCKSSLCDIKLDGKCEPAVFQCVLCVWTLLCRLRVRGLGTCWAPLFVFLQE